MSLLDDLLGAVRQDAEVKEVRIGAFLTAVVSSGCGLASTVMESGHPHGQTAVGDAGVLQSRSALALARLARSDSALERSVGIAALNSLLEVDFARCVELNAADYLAEKGHGKRIALVGHFPFVSSLREVAGRLDVLELHPQAGDLPAEEAAMVVPRADVLAITGSALVNGTIEGLLGLRQPDASVIVLGPSTPLSPVWFDHGVDVVSGVAAVDAAMVLRYVSEGAIFRQVRGVRLLTMVRDR